MLNIILDREQAIVTLEPEGTLTKEDFETAAKIIDPFIEKHGKLAGMIIATKSFPGWEDFSALVRHMNFIKNHHKKIKRLAFVTDSEILGKFSENVSAHFVSAEIKYFKCAQRKEAREWILGKEEGA
jgi:hypothetical protein